MIRGEIFSLVGPIGALGISSETSANLAKERRDTTKAPPGEMLIAVANSSESRPFPSRVRTKTGMARSNRAHFRCSFLDKLPGTYIFRPFQATNLQIPHLRGQTPMRHIDSLKTRSEAGLSVGSIPVTLYATTQSHR
jgi:hypothetical protein